MNQLAQGFNTAAQDSKFSNLGSLSLSQESKALPRIHCSNSPGDIGNKLNSVLKAVE